MKNFENFIKNSEIVFKMSYQDLALITNSEANVCVAIKTEDHKYLFANKSFMELYGLNNNLELIAKNDNVLSNNKSLVKKYLDHDDSVFKDGQVKSFRELLEPKLNKTVSKFMHCKILPLQIDSTKTNAILRIYTPENDEFFLNLEKTLDLPSVELEKRLVKKSYHF